MTGKSAAEKAKTDRLSASADIGRIKAWVDTNLSADVVIIPSIFTLKKKLNLIEMAFTSFREAQRILEHNDVNEISDALVKTTEDAYVEASCHLEERINTMTVSNTPASEKGKDMPTLVMPQVKIDVFTGEDPTQWLSYHTKFKALVHDKDFDVSYKFEILRQTLGGEAARQIKDLEATAANYQKALDMLINRWHNPKLLTFSHLEKIFELPTLQAATTTNLLHLVDTVRGNLRALESLKCNVAGYNDVLVYWILKRLDSTTKRKFEESSNKEMPKVEDLLVWLEAIAQVIRSTTNTTTNHSATKGMNSAKGKRCSVCKDPHSVMACQQFKRMSIAERWEKVKKHGLCRNCLGQGHIENECRSGSCRKCDQKHHTMLCNTASAHHASTSFHASNQLLPTVIVLVQDSKGDYIRGRAILDSASQYNFISERFVQVLGIRKIKENVRVQTTGSSYENTHTAAISIKSRFNQYTKELSALVQRNITNYKPPQTIKNAFNIPANIELADPEFHQSNRVDLLLSVEVLAEVLSVGCISLGNGKPTLQKTLLGWMIYGSCKASSTNEEQGIAHHTTSTDEQTENNYTADLSAKTRFNSNRDVFDMQKFWEIEDLNDLTDLTYTPTEQRVEQHFASTVTKTPNGYYQVKLPFKPNHPTLGRSRRMAQTRLDALMRRLDRNHEQKKLYTDFMDQYLSLGHMTEVPKHEQHKVKYFIPHHAILRPESTTTKLRVVFDASAKTDNGISLNDILEKGPQLQQDLFSILCRFRTHLYAACADVEKMFRQIRVEPEDSYWQCILWKNKVYRLTTVTYGTRPAPYLAIRVLRQCALDNQISFPLAAHVIQRDFYMDDLQSGADDENSLEILQQQLNAILSTCSMHLRKWVVNSQTIMNKIPVEDRAECQLFDTDDYIKTLGMIYHPADDSFRVKINIDLKRKITKRSIQSDIARMFDPLGLLAPVIAALKMILQQLWCLKLYWDESPPQCLNTKYDSIRQQLGTLEDFRIPRCIKVATNSEPPELHGFCDASELGYAATIFLVTTNGDGTKTSRLLCSKNRVAPLKKLTLPRLELCGAELLAQLVTRVKKDLNLETKAPHYWTDSTIVLRWLQKESRHLNTFVANRVSRIQSTTNVNSWSYVPTAENPADLPTRGKSPEEFLEATTNTLWFNGPSFLTGPRQDWPKIPFEDRELPEIKNKFKTAGSTMFAAATITYTDLVKEMDSRFQHSALAMQRIFSYVGKFIQKCKQRVIQRKANQHVHPLVVQSCPSRVELTVAELDYGLTLILKNIQRSSFNKERSAISNQLPLQGKFRHLKPFIEDDLIRVGGRLTKGALAYNVKHPVILPQRHIFTKALMRHYHYKYLHCGQTALLAAIRQNYWPINARQVANSVARSCNICFFCKPKPIFPSMGHLPREALAPGYRAFTNVAVDFASGFYIHQRGRGRRPTKAYVCVFVCMATHAIHLEVTEELSTKAFIACIRRFIGRRGLCRKIFCDNGTNFVGANKELGRLVKQLSADEINEDLKNERIEFSFSPPYSPHFNALAEAGVKSVKTHLRRVAGNASLTYEEMNTLLIQIEAVLNSRPLVPMSEDPADFDYLTPGHFTVFGPLKSFPEPIDDDKVSLLTRYHRLRQLIQHFWKRWSVEYLTNKQQRLKWHKNNPNLKVGELVMINDDNRRPHLWSVGRITAVYPGSDGVTRVAEVNTCRGPIKRAVHKLCPLPSQPSY